MGFPQQFFIINNGINTFSINTFVAMTSFPPSATGTPQQHLQPKRKPTMAIAKYRPMDSCDLSNYNHNNNNHRIQTCLTSATATAPFIFNACKSNNNTMSKAIPIQLNPSTTRVCRRYREGKC